MPSKSKYKHKVLSFKNLIFFIVNFSISGQKQLSPIQVLDSAETGGSGLHINADRKHYKNNVKICSCMNNKKCRPYKKYFMFTKNIIMKEELVKPLTQDSGYK